MLTLMCLYFCGTVEPALSRVLKKDGGEVIKASCPQCGAYIQFVPRTGAWLSMLSVQEKARGASAPLP